VGDVDGHSSGRTFRPHLPAAPSGRTGWASPTMSRRRPSGSPGGLMPTPRSGAAFDCTGAPPSR